MKLKVCVGGLVWIAVITIAHIHANVGWDRFLSETRRTIGLEEGRQELVVGFLPVT